MKHEPTDGHPCGSCLRWPECNGVEWPRCQDTKKDDDGILVQLPPEAVARLARNVVATLNERRKRGRIL